MMPTAVERLFDSFGKFDNAVEEVKLNDAFLKIDAAFQTLANFNGDGLDFLKIEHDLKLQQTFNVIGEGFLKVGVDFQKVDTALKLTDQFVIKLMDGHKIGELVPAVQVDFNALDQKVNVLSTDFKVIGVDFMKLDSSPSLKVFDHKLETLSVDCRKAGGDAAAAVDMFTKLGDDFIELGRKAGGDSKLLDGYKTFGNELLTVGQTFNTLSEALVKLSKGFGSS